jgi:membrane associated rhomboid family serine protease
MITGAIILITCLISYLAFNDNLLMERLLFIPSQIEKYKEYYRFITSGLVHNDYMHLLLNMFVLYSFGTLVEKEFSYMLPGFGGVIFLLFYITALIVSDYPSFLKYRFSGYYRSLGASGATSAVIFASIMFFPLGKILLFGILPLKSWLFAILYIAYESYMNKQRMDNVAHDVHIYGALYGVLFVTAIEPSVLLQFFQVMQEALITGDIF